MLNEILEFSDCAKILLKDNTGKVVGQAIIDLDDLEKVKKFKWHLTNAGYVIGYMKGAKIKPLLHHIILGVKENHYTDHINGNTLDNRKSNLRFLTPSLNVLTGRLSSRNRSGKKGVSVIKKNNKTQYKAYIRVDGVVHNLGIHKNLNDAVKARQEAELRLLGKLLDY